MENRKELREYTLKIEIIPPPRCSRSRLPVTCSCCRKQVEPSEQEAMEYGICEECIRRP
jgi:predicted amidophosphoribosyltransferase